MVCMEKSSSERSPNYSLERVGRITHVTEEKFMKNQKVRTLDICKLRCVLTCPGEIQQLFPMRLFGSNNFPFYGLDDMRIHELDSVPLVGQIAQYLGRL